MKFQYFNESTKTNLCYIYTHLSRYLRIKNHLYKENNESEFNVNKADIFSQIRSTSKKFLEHKNYFDVFKKSKSIYIVIDKPLEYPEGLRYIKPQNRSTRNSTKSQ